YLSLRFRSSDFCLLYSVDSVIFGESVVNDAVCVRICTSHRADCIMRLHSDRSVRYTWRLQRIYWLRFLLPCPAFSFSSFFFHTLVCDCRHRSCFGRNRSLYTQCNRLSSARPGCWNALLLHFQAAFARQRACNGNNASASFRV